MAKVPKDRSTRKRAYRIKLEIDIRVMIDQENNKIDRGLQISLKDSEKYFESLDDEFLRNYIADEFDFFSNRCFDDLKIFLAYLRSEIGYNQIGNVSDREVFIQNCLQAYEKGMRKRLKSNKGRPKVEYSFAELLDSVEVDLFVFEIFNAIRKLELDGSKIRKASVARELFNFHSNPAQALDRKLKQFQLTFYEILTHYLNKTGLYNDRLDEMLKSSPRKN